MMTETMTSESDAETRTHRQPFIRRPGIVGGLVCALLSVLVAVVYMGNAATDCTSQVRGAPGDGTNGAVWLNFVWNESGGSPLASTQHETGAPIGDALWRPESVTNAAVTLPMWAVAKISGPVCAYNVAVGVGHVTSALGMYALAWHVTRSRLSSIFAGLLYGFSAFTQLKSEGHIGGVYLGGFPLLILGLLLLWERPTPRRALIVAVPWAWLCYVDGYYLPFSLLLVTLFVVGAIAAELGALTSRDDVRRLARRVIAVAMAGAATVVLLVPWLLSVLGDRERLVMDRGRTLDEAHQFSARPLEYLIPAHTHPLFYSWSAGWRSGHLHGSNAVESTLYLGCIPLLLAMFWLIGRRWWSPWPSLISPSQRLATFAFLFVGIGGFVASLSPRFRVFGVGVPMPSRILWELFPALRVFSRLFVVVSAATVALAAMGLADLSARITERSARAVVAVAITAVAMFETLAVNPRHPPTWSFAQSPAAYRETGNDSTVGLVARYPLTSPAETPENPIFTFQLALDRPLLNPAADPAGADDAAGLARGLASLTDPQTLPALRALGVDTLLIERQTFGAKPPDLGGLRLQASYDYTRDDAGRQSNGGPQRWAYLSPYYDVDVYRVLPGPTAPAVVALGSGWNGPEGAWSTGRWMSDDGEVFVHDLGDADEMVTVGFAASSFAVDRDLAIFDGSNEIARFRVSPTESHEFEFVAPVGRPLTFHSTPSADPVAKYDPTSTDPRNISVRVSGWGVSEV